MLLTGLFLFENILALMKEVEKNLRQDLLQQSQKTAELLMPEIKAKGTKAASSYFDSLEYESGKGPAIQVIGRSGYETICVRIAVSDQKTLLFCKKMHSPALNTVTRLKEIIHWINIAFAFLLLISAIYLLVTLFRKKKDVKEERLLSPLQEYLLELKDSQKELESFLQEQNISSQKREDLNKSIINNLHLALVFLDRTGKVELFNPAAQRIFGCSYSAAVNSSLKDICKNFPGIQNWIESDKKKGSQEIECGERFFFIDRIPVAEHGTLILLREITEEKKRDRIQRVNSSLILLGEMTAALAHEIKNSLGVMLGYTKMLEAESENTGKIINEIHYLTQMMENFLQFARPVQVQNLQECDLKEIIGELSETQEIEVRFTSPPPSIKSDPVLLHSILANLILNSRQAGATLLNISFKGGSPLYIYLEDNGSGINESIRSKIWLPFFSTKEKGTGMGLPIVKKLVNSLNGEIQFLENAEQKTIFELTFYLD